VRSAVLFFAASVGALAPACKDDAEPAAPTAAPPPAPAPQAPALDAAPPPDGITAIGGFDPSSGLHLDEDTPGARRGGVASVHTHRTLEIILRSTPSGATVAVDGVVVGQTPGYWEGEFTGREREFTFVMPGYAMARYRFVPTSNGVVHGRLVKIVADQSARAPAIPRPADLVGPAPAASPAPPAATSLPPAPPDAPEAEPPPATDAGTPPP
jgi:hypothetical protein